MKAIGDCRLYGIIDLGYIAAKECARVAREMITGGVDIIQLRAKELPLESVIDLARHLHPVTAAAGIPLIVNDHAEVARAVPVDGVHVGQDDEPVATVREKAGRKTLVGKSTHSLAQAQTAAIDKPDYIGFGPLFATPTKPDYEPIGLADIARVHAEVALPIFCIGGIKLENLPAVIAAGAQRVVIVSGMLKADDIADYARTAKSLLLAIENRKSTFENSPCPS